MNQCIDIMILITNDDGYNATGIRKLYESASGLDETIMVAPDSMRSASGMTMSFTVPLRMNSLENYGINGYSISGYPADCIAMAKHILLKDKNIDLVISGINYGSNISLRALYTSGTISAAMAAALTGIKGMAFSMVTENANTKKGADFDKAGIISKYIISEFLKNGFPENADVLNINFPEKIDENTKIKVVPMLKNVFVDFVNSYKDPTGKDYYWFGNTMGSFNEKNSDYYVLMKEKNISVTPLTVHGHNVKDLNPTIKFFNNVSQAIYEDDISDM